MNDYDFDEDEIFEKVPYDEVPINRGTSFGAHQRSRFSTHKESRGSSSGRAPSRWQTLLISFLIIINLAFGGVMVTLINRLNKPTAINNLDVKINSVVASDILNAATKAKFSAVCVNVGNRRISTITEFYNSLASRGSGVFIDVDKETGNGYVLTCYHVVQSYPYIYVLPFAGSEPIQATLINYSYSYDIALLKIENSAALQNSLAVACEIADSSSLVEGQTAIAIGNALNSGLSVTSGIISSTVNFINVSNNSNMRVIKVDTAINSGNSGGGLFDINGKLIGIVNAKQMSSEIDNVAFAIPSNLAIGIGNSIKHYGSGKSPNYAVLGVLLAEDTNSTTIDSTTGAVVNSIYVTQAYGSAYSAGIQENDVLVSITYGSKTVEIKGLYDIIDHMYNVFVGDTVNVTVNRGGSILNFEVVITTISQ